MYNKNRDEVSAILTQLLINHGYTVTHSDERFVECLNDDTNISFSQMKEDESYIEATLNITTDEGIALYDIFTGEYSAKLFDENSKPDVFLKEEMVLLTNEVERLAFPTYQQHKPPTFSVSLRTFSLPMTMCSAIM